MDIFGTGQGSGKPQVRQESPEEQEAKAKAAVGCVILLLTAKYLPVVLLGALLGTVTHRGARGSHGWRRFKDLLFGLSFFGALLFLCVGLPLQKPQAPLFGLLYRFEGFKNGVVDCLLAWNREFDLPIIKALRFDLHKMTYHDVTNYFWIAIAAAGALVLLLEVWSYFRPKDRASREEIGIGTRLCRIPALAIETTIGLVLTRWVSGGRAIARSLGREGIRAFLGATLLMVTLGFIALGVVAYGLPRLLPMAFADLVGYLFFGPAVGVGVGFCFGAVHYVTNGRLSLPPLGHGKQNEFYLGIDFRGRPYGLSEKNLSYHVEIIAPTGSGKTNLLKNLIADRIARGHGLIFLDLKAEFQVVAWMMRAAEASGRGGELRLVSLANRELSVPYNPVKQGSAPEIHSQLMNSMSWSEDYYRKISSIALMTLLRGLCEYRDRTGENFHLGHLHDLLNEPGLLRSLAERCVASNCPAAREVEHLAEKLDRPSERKDLTGLIANLGLLIHSAAGPLISEDVSSGSFDFREAVDQGRITYVLMNSMKLRETATVFGKMILQDLMRLAGDRYSEMGGGKRHQPVTLIIDEFAAFAIPEFIDFMDRARGAGIGIVFAHQSRADLRAVSPEFQDRIEANANTVIVSGVKSSEDAEYFAGQLGTRTVKKETTQVEDGFFGPKHTGMKSIRDVEEYVVHPNRLKDLKLGEVFTVSRTVDPRWAMVHVPQADEFATATIDQAELVRRLTKIRGEYMTGQREKYLDLVAAARIPGLTQAKHPKHDASIPDQDTKVQAQQSSGPELWS